MEKIDRRKRYFLMLDTETCNGFMENNKLNLSCSMVYDIGCAIVDRYGNVYEELSFVISDVFEGMSEQMQTAYYADKIPTYIADIDSGSREYTSLFKARGAIIQLMKMYNCNTVVAHNAGFDLRALNNTLRYLTKSKYRYFFPYGTEWFDTLKMAGDTFGRQKMYKVWCEKNGFMTKHKTPRPRLTAEILYRYITGDMDFEEEHTGLADVLIETIILKECYKKHMKMRKRLFE